MNRRTGMWCLTVATCLACWASVASAAGPFDQGRIRVSFGAATGGSSGNRYIVFGAGFGYYVVDGLELGFDAEGWLGGDPDMAKVSPQMRYVFHMVPILAPYIGSFYKHWFVGGDYDDVDTIGGRLGAFFVGGGGLFFGGGVVYEAIVSECDEDCTDVYPEIVLSVTF